MRKPTIRKVMILIALIAVGLGLGLPAIEVYRTKDYHGHTGIDTARTPTLTARTWVEAPFWPRYLRRLCGQTWRNQPLCGPTPGYEAEICEFAEPDIKMVGRFGVAYRFTSAQARALAEIQERNQRDAAKEPSDTPSQSDGTAGK